MAKAKPKTPKAPDKEQSKRFVEAARKLEAAGELNLTVAAERFERAFGKMVKQKGGPERG